MPILFKSGTALSGTENRRSRRQRTGTFSRKKLLFAATMLLTSWNSPQSLFAQTTTITTENSTGFSSVYGNVGTNNGISFVLENTNTYDIILTGLDAYLGAANAGAVPTLWYSATSLSGRPIVAAPDWAVITSGVGLNVPADGYLPVLPNLHFVIPANTQYRFIFQSSTGVKTSGTSGQPGAVSPSVLSSNGVNLKVYDAQVAGAIVGYTGNNFFFFNGSPRAFTGRVHFTPAVSNPPVAAGGQAVSTAAAVCPNAPFRLSVMGATPAVNLTYQWQSSPDSINWVNIAGATGFDLNKTQLGTTFYRAKVTSGSLTANSGGVKVVTTAVPVTGTFTIDKNSPASATNFQTFAAAIASLDCKGVSGPVTFNVAAGSGPYSEQVVIPVINGTSATSPVIFKGNGNTLTSPVTTGAVLKLNGADFLVFDSLKVETNATATDGDVVLLTNEANGNIFRQCIFTHSLSTTTATSHVVAVTLASSNNLFQDNTLKGAYVGIYNYGDAYLKTKNNRFIRNRIQDPNYYGIMSYYNTGSLYEANDISRPTRTNGSSMYAFYLGNGGTATTVSSNRIHNTHDASPGLGGNVFGIYSAFSGLPGSENIIKNNAIYNIGNTGGNFYGLYNAAADNTYYYHNTVSADMPTITYNILRGIHFATAGNNQKFINNNISLSSTAGNKHGIYLTAPPFSLASDNNNLYVPNGFIGYAPGDKATLADWRTATFNVFDLASVSADPMFTSLATGNIAPTVTSVNDKGKPLPAVTDDISGAPRSATTPDPGAVEFNVSSTDVGVVAISGPDPASCGLSAAESVTITIRNFGIAPQSNIPVSYTINGSGTVNETFTGTVAPNSTATYTFTAKANLSAGTTFTLVAGTGLTGDSDASNNANTWNLVNPKVPALPFTFDFETAATGFARLRKVVNLKSNITEDAGASNGTGSVKGLILDGVDHPNWLAPAGLTDPWTNNPDNFAGVYFCMPTSGLAATDSLWLNFDLKQLYKLAHVNTNFRVMINGSQYGSTFRPPFSGSPINWQQVSIDLTPYKNNAFIQIGLESSVKEAYANGTGTANLIDNIMIERTNVSQPTGVKENALAANLRVFPNPGNGTFNVSLENDRVYDLKVTDLSGKVILKQTANGDAKLNLEGAAKGIYLLHVTSENDIIVRKLIVE